jgi:hypothetical protein
MRKVFVLLAIDCGSGLYLKSAKNLVEEILKQTDHDIILSTNNVQYFDDIKDGRLLVRDNINKDITLSYNSEFNYNLKHYAFKDIPEHYDVVIYLDCDIKLDGWVGTSDKYIDTIMSNYNYGACRLNCLLKQIKL